MDSEKKSFNLTELCCFLLQDAEEEPINKNSNSKLNYCVFLSFSEFFNAFFKSLWQHKISTEFHLAKKLGVCFRIDLNVSVKLVSSLKKNYHCLVLQAEKLMQLLAMERWKRNL